MQTRNKNIQQLIGVITGLLFCINVSAQGAVDGFNKGKGNLDLVFSSFFERSGYYFAGLERRKLERNLIGISVYGAYGITDKWDVIAATPLINFQPQDAQLFTKYRVFKVHLTNKLQWDLFPAMGVSFPMSNYKTETANAIGQRATQFMPKLITQFTGNKWFVQAQGGYNHALSPVVSSAVGSIKAGYFNSGWYFDCWFEHQEGFGDKDYLGSVPFDSFRELVVTYNKVGVSIYKSFNQKIGGTLNISQVINGRNIGQATALSVGIVWKPLQ